MTTEEIAAAVFEKQGFLIVAAMRERQIGATIVNPRSGLKPDDRVQVALIIVAEGTVKEYDDQATFARQIASVPKEGSVTYPFYYRCIPGD